MVLHIYKEPNGDARLASVDEEKNTQGGGRGHHGIPTQLFPVGVLARIRHETNVHWLLVDFMISIVNR
jgi:hypothetical protein